MFKLTFNRPTVAKHFGDGINGMRIKVVGDRVRMQPTTEQPGKGVAAIGMRARGGAEVVIEGALEDSLLGLLSGPGMSDYFLVSEKNGWIVPQPFKPKRGAKDSAPARTTPHIRIWKVRSPSTVGLHRRKEGKTGVRVSSKLPETIKIPEEYFKQVRKAKRTIDERAGRPGRPGANLQAARDLWDRHCKAMESYGVMPEQGRAIPEPEQIAEMTKRAVLSAFAAPLAMRAERKAAGRPKEEPAGRRAVAKAPTARRAATAEPRARGRRGRPPGRKAAAESAAAPAAEPRPAAESRQPELELRPPVAEAAQQQQEAPALATPPVAEPPPAAPEGAAAAPEAPAAPTVVEPAAVVMQARAVPAEQPDTSSVTVPSAEDEGDPPAPAHQVEEEQPVVETGRIPAARPLIGSFAPEEEEQPGVDAAAVARLSERMEADAENWRRSRGSAGRSGGFRQGGRPNFKVERRDIRR